MRCPCAGGRCWHTARCHRSRAPRGFDGDYGGGSLCSMGSVPVAQYANGPVIEFVRLGPKFKEAPWPQQLFALFPFNIIQSLPLKHTCHKWSVSVSPGFLLYVSCKYINCNGSWGMVFVLCCGVMPQGLSVLSVWTAGLASYSGGFKGNKGSFSSGSLSSESPQISPSQCSGDTLSVL